MTFLNFFWCLKGFMKATRPSLNLFEAPQSVNRKIYFNYFGILGTGRVSEFFSPEIFINI